MTTTEATLEVEDIYTAYDAAEAGAHRDEQERELVAVLTDEASVLYGRARAEERKAIASARQCGHVWSNAEALQEVSSVPAVVEAWQRYEAAVIVLGRAVGEAALAAGHTCTSDFAHNAQLSAALATHAGPDPNAAANGELEEPLVDREAQHDADYAYMCGEFV